MFRNLFEFYRSSEWEEFRKIVIAERTREDGFVYDDITNKPILKAYDLILHHKIELTEENVRDFEISLNKANIQIVSHKTHNLLHHKLGGCERKVYLVYGAPLCGKREWVKDMMVDGDLLVDIESIWECVSGRDCYTKPPRLNAVVFKVRDELLDAVKYRLGKWRTAYVVGGYPMQTERARLCRDLGAEEIYIESTKEECLERANKIPSEWKGYIEQWFDRAVVGVEENSG